MTATTLLKRVLPAVPFAMLAMAAYFQARAASSLLRAELLPAHPPRPRRASTAPVTKRRQPSATSILEGRMFAPAPPAGPEPPEAPAVTPAPPGAAADEVPKCDVGHVVLIAAGRDPRTAQVVIQDSKREQHLLHLGESIEGHQLARVAYDRVWLRQGESRCRMELGDKPPKPKKAPARRPRRKRPLRRGRVPSDLAAKITAVGENEYRVERSAVDRIVENYASLLRGTRMRPVKRDGQVVGAKLRGVRRGSLLHRLGMRSGDVVSSINGFDLTNPQKALEAYARLRTADRVSVQLERGGKPVTVDIAID